HNSYDFKHGLNTAIQKIREALDDSSENSRFIETVPGRGYRFLLPVEFIPNASSNESNGACPDKDLFLSTIPQIRQEFLCTCYWHKLNELRHRLSVLMDQYPQHPS